MRELKFLFCVLFLSSCSNDYSYLVNDLSIPEPLFEVNLDTIFNISVDSNQYFYHDYRQIIKIDDSLFYFGRNRADSKSIDFFNLLSGASAKINAEHHEIPGLGQYYVHNKDSIFFTSEVPPTLYLINFDGELLNKIRLENAPIDWDVNEYYFESLYEYHAPLYTKDGRIHFQLSSLDYWDRDKSKFKFLTWYDLNTKTWGPNFGDPIEAYALSNIEYPYSQSSAFFNVLGDTSYLSFPLSHKVLMYNNCTGELLMEKVIGSDYLRKLPEPFRKNKMLPQQQMDFIYSAGLYGEPYYHEETGIFSRYVIHEKEAYDLDGKVLSEKFRKYSLVMFDRNLNHLGEFMLDDEHNRPGRSQLGTPNGFILRNSDPQLVSEDRLLENAHFIFRSKN